MSHLLVMVRLVTMLLVDRARMKVTLLTLLVATRARMKKMIMCVKGTYWMMILYLKKILETTS